MTPQKKRRAADLERRVDAVLHRPRQAMRRLFGSSGALSDLFYGLLDHSFGREHRGVLWGIFRYQQLEGNRSANRFMLRRNTHRLEKGLLMRPRKDIFALAYIEETVLAYERCHTEFQGHGGDESELRWSRDVLREYFEISAADPLIDRLRAQFEGFGGLPNDATTDAESKPYRRDLDGPLPVEFDDFYKLSKRRRSVRWFVDKPVPRDDIDRAIVAAAEAPSACNRQPFVFRVFDDKELVEEVANLPMGTRGFAHNFPAIVVVVGQLRAYFKPRDRHLIYIDGSLAAMSFMLALETLGLSSCPINWPDIPARERRMAKLLNLEPDQRPIMLIAVGYPDPDGEVAFSHKQSLDHLRTYNK